jgi:hypothetical protein
MEHLPIPTLARADLVVDAALWDRLTEMAAARDCDPEALASSILLRAPELMP